MDRDDNGREALLNPIDGFVERERGLLMSRGMVALKLTLDTLTSLLGEK